MNTSFSHTILGLCLGSLSILACACSSDESGASETNQSLYKKYDPCALVTQAEAEAALGVKVLIDRHDTETTSPIGNKICYYNIATEDDMKFVQIAINEQASMTNGLTAESLYKSTKDLLGTTTAVAGVGDDAYYGGSGLKAGAGLTALIASKGVTINLMVGLGKGNTDEAAHIALEKTLALKAISRL